MRFRHLPRHGCNALVHLCWKLELLDATISSHFFSTGFDIRTPVGFFTAKKVPLSLTGEHRMLDSSGNQIARLEAESFISTIYNIIITGGGFYQFRSGADRRNWTCEGEGKLFCISEQAGRRIVLSEDAQKIAECSKSRFFNDYEIRIFNDADLKFAICVFIALSLAEHQSPDMPD